MGLFSKKKNNVVWRDKNGMISCPGDNCPSECDDSCPIWLNTMGMTLLQMGQYEKAIEQYKEGIKLASDMSDLWNNMASCFGNMRRFQDAYESYKKAYELAGKKNALYGLALSARDCGRKEEALAYCKEYREKFHDGALDRVESELSGKNITQESHSTLYMDMLVDFLEMGTKQGYVSFGGSIPFIPELSAQADHVCNKLFKDLSDAIDNDPEANYDMMKKFDLSASWSAFAGMGAVWFWNENWDELREQGIIEKLSAPEGVDCLDDVVLDSVGMGRMSEESKDFREFLHAISIVSFKHIPEADKTEPRAIISALRERNKAMFMFGIAVEMHRLGMN